MKAALKNLYAFVRFVWRRLLLSKCQQGAAALTYTSLFALVPMMTVAYVLLSFMPALETLSLHIEGLVFSNFLPETGNQVKAYLEQFSQQAKSLTIPGIAMLVITALMMLRTIEGTFNNIWDVKHGRRGVSSFLLYWAVLSLGPVLAGAGLMFSTYLLSLNFLNDIQQIPSVQPITNLIPFAFTTAALCLIYITVPNCRVSFRHALVGAITASLCFELAKKAFAYVAVHSSYTLIYGAFAIVPLFLLWLYLSWMIVLCGAVLVRSIGIYKLSEGSAYSPFMLALICLRIFWQKQQNGQTVKAADMIRGKGMGIGILGFSQWEQLQNLLVEKNFIRNTDDGDYVLSRDLHTVSLWELSQLFGARYSEQALAPSPELLTQNWYTEMRGLLAQTESNSQKILQRTLADLFASENRT